MIHPNTPRHIAAGEILAGKYRVERVLGMGAMGLVVAATHLDLHEVRAIKLMRLSDPAEPQFVERFLREARAVVKLRSEHVAQVYDIGRLECGAPYIVMELLEGEDLAELLKQRGRLSVEEAALYVVQACNAIAEAHALGIVHRDLKPANLFLTHRGDGSTCIKVLDFGISKRRAAAGAEAVEMTAPGYVMGSPLYMAPEQMRSSREADARSDIWSLGAILFKLLTGSVPFHATTTPEIFAAVLAPTPTRPPSSLRPELPPELDAVVMRCLDKDPKRRFACAADLAAALQPYLLQNASHSERPKATRPAHLSTLPLNHPEMQAVAALRIAQAMQQRPAPPPARPNWNKATLLMPPAPASRPSATQTSAAPSSQPGVRLAAQSVTALSAGLAPQPSSTPAPLAQVATAPTSHRVSAIPSSVPPAAVDVRRSSHAIGGRTPRNALLAATAAIVALTVGGLVLSFTRPSSVHTTAAAGARTEPSPVPATPRETFAPAALQVSIGALPTDKDTKMPAPTRAKAAPSVVPAPSDAPSPAGSATATVVAAPLPPKRLFSTWESAHRAPATEAAASAGETRNDQEADADVINVHDPWEERRAKPSSATPATAR